MTFLILYLAVSFLVASWTGWLIHKKLDNFDWTYNKDQIWLDFALRTVFWPLMLLFKPTELIIPKFGLRSGSLGFDLANSARERNSFMQNPPPCSSKIIYRTFDRETKADTAIFYFSASVVEVKALQLIDDDIRVDGLHATAMWSSQRDDSIDEPTELPIVLDNFDFICEGLIEDGHGQVHCIACKKVYMVSKLIRETGMIGSWLVADYKCPEQHLLLSRDVAHFMFRRD